MYFNANERLNSIKIWFSKNNKLFCIFQIVEQKHVGTVDVLLDRYEPLLWLKNTDNILWQR